MNSGPVDRSTANSSPVLDGFDIPRRPYRGFGLLAASAIGTLAVLIYFGAWASADRIEDRALAADTTVLHTEAEWWEDGLLSVCPLH